MPDAAMHYSEKIMDYNNNSNIGQYRPLFNSTEGNISDMNVGEELDQAFSGRFMAYTLILAGCLTLNTLSLLAMSRMQGRRSVHHTLILNQAVTDIVGSLLLWMYYNSPYIFPRFQIVTLPHCLFIVAVLVGPFILALSTGSLTLLTLALNQYFAICHPLKATTNVTKHKAYIVIGMIWLFSATLAMIPALIVIALPECNMWVHVVGVKALEVCTYGLGVLIIIIVALYGRIYREIVNYRKRMPQLGRNNAHSSEQEHHFKAFITTFLLTGTLIVFWLPYTLFHVVGANVDDYNDIPLWVIYAKMYIIDFSPLLNYLADPIIYGIRMREIRQGYYRLFSYVIPCCVKRAAARVTVRSSVRFSTIGTTKV